MITDGKIKTFLHNNNLPEIEISPEKLSLLNKYVTLLRKWNRKINLVSRREVDNLEYHILDSLVIAPFLQCKNITDLGSGGGLPAIPLSILFSDKEFTLVEVKMKKTSFLKMISLELNLTNITIINERVENLIKKDFSTECITSRAFAPLNELLDYSFPLLGKNGKIYSLTGGFFSLPENERFKIVKFLLYTLPDRVKKRQLIILEKKWVK